MFSQAKHIIHIKNKHAYACVCTLFKRRHLVACEEETARFNTIKSPLSRRNKFH